MAFTQEANRAPAIDEDPKLLYISSYPEAVTAWEGKVDGYTQIVYVLRGQRDPAGGLAPYSLYFEKHEWLRDAEGNLGTRLVTGEKAGRYETIPIQKDKKEYRGIRVPLESGGELSIPYTQETYNSDTKAQALKIHGISGLPSYELSGKPSKEMKDKEYNWSIQEENGDFHIYGNIDGKKAKIKDIQLGIKVTHGGWYNGIGTFRLAGEAEQKTEAGETETIEVHEDTTVYEAKTETQGYCYTPRNQPFIQTFPYEPIHNLLENSSDVLNKI